MAWRRGDRELLRERIRGRDHPDAASISRDALGLAVLGFMTEGL